MSSGGTRRAENKSVSWGFSSLRRFCRLRMSVALFSNATAATCLCRSSSTRGGITSWRPLLARLGADLCAQINHWVRRAVEQASRRWREERREILFVHWRRQARPRGPPAAAAPRDAARRRWGPVRVPARRGTCFSRRFGRWEPGPVGGMGVGFGEGA